MELSIIIVSWNTQELLARCLESIFTYPPSVEFDVWVVDNASSDGSARMVKENYRQAHLIENIDNLGFARANNQAVLQSHGRYVLLLNPDTEGRQGAIDTLLSFVKDHPDAGTVGARP
jgi:GT2 family glycosyltransferase